MSTLANNPLTSRRTLVPIRASVVRTNAEERSAQMERSSLLDRKSLAARLQQ
jgi:hypothetical protein